MDGFQQHSQLSGNRRNGIQEMQLGQQRAQQAGMSNQQLPMSMQSPNIGQEMLTRLLFQLPPDNNTYQPNQVVNQVPTQNYPMQKPLAPQNRMLFQGNFQAQPHPSTYPPMGMEDSYHYNAAGFSKHANPFLPQLSAPVQRKETMPPLASVVPLRNSTPSEARSASQNHDSEEKARAVRVPEDKEFSTTLDMPLVKCLRKGGKQLNSLQMRKLQDATSLLQSMETHKLQPLCLYTGSELFEIMASIAETWKNSGKAAWKKRINKIKENARGRKAPRNKLDAQEIAEIEHLQKLCHDREQWEAQEKAKIAEERRKRKMMEVVKDDVSSRSATASKASKSTSKATNGKAAKKRKAVKSENAKR